MLLKPPGLQHFRAVVKSSMTRQRLLGAQEMASTDHSADGTTGELRAKKPLQFDAITQTDNGEIVFDVEAFEMEQEAGVKEDVDQDLESSKGLQLKVAAPNEGDTTSSTNSNKTVDSSADDGASTESPSKKIQNRRFSSTLKGRNKMKAANMLSISEGKKSVGDSYEEGVSDDDEYDDMDNEDAARRSHAENDLPMSHPYLHSLHPKGPPPKQWTFEDVVSGHMQQTKTTWGKLQSMVIIYV